MRRGYPVSASEWSGQGWNVAITDTEMTITLASGSVRIRDTNASQVRIRRRWFQWSLCNIGESPVRLRGITKSDASDLGQAIQHLALAPAIADATTWHVTVTDLLTTAHTAQRWIPTEAIDSLVATRPE